MNTLRKLSAGVVTSGSVGALFVGIDGLRDSRKEAKASGGELHPPEFPWVFNDYGKVYDAMALRRGWHVYKNVCKTCHSMEYMSFRELTNHSHTVDEVKAIAAEFETVDEDQDEFGEDIIRKCKHFDRVPNPYKNDNAARAANGGALPPDLSLICYARDGGENYLYALLNGYCDPPAGVSVMEGMNYNPYFAGGGLGMAQPVYNETVDYKEMGDMDAKPYQSQITKDIVSFLRWVTDIPCENHKLYFHRLALLGIPTIFLSWLWMKRNWSSVKGTSTIRSQDLRKFK